MSFEERLIECVRPHEYLYSLHHQQFRRTDKKEKTWKEISQTLNSTTDLCKKRWKGLRDTYKRLRKNESLPSGSGAEEPFKKKWKYFDCLTFLDEFADARRSIGNDTVETVRDEFFGDESSDMFTSTAKSTKGTSQPQKTFPRKRDVADPIQKKFCEILEAAKNTIRDFPIPPSTPTKSSTEVVLGALAVKIDAANLPPSIRNYLEARITRIVYETLAEYS